MSHHPLMGASIASKAILRQDESEFGRLPIVRVYNRGLPKKNAWTTGLAAANDSAVIVSFKALPSKILSGADNRRLKHFFRTAPTGHRIYYSYYHEPEDNIANGQFTARAYRRAWGHIVKIARKVHNRDLRSTLILMAYDLKSASGRDWRNYLPRGGIINTLGWDAYPVGDTHLTAPRKFMGPAVAAAKAAGLHFGFAEFGVTTQSGRGTWLRKVGRYIRKSGARFGTLFDSSPPMPSMRLTNPGSINAWEKVVTRSDTDNGIRTDKSDSATIVS
jgi:hypothetical protein